MPRFKVVDDGRGNVAVWDWDTNTMIAVHTATTGEQVAASSPELHDVPVLSVIPPAKLGQLVCLLASRGRFDLIAEVGSALAEFDVFDSVTFNPYAKTLTVAIEVATTLHSLTSEDIPT